MNRPKAPNRSSSAAASRDKSSLNLKPPGEPIPVLSLFSGAGVLDYAIEITGRFQVVTSIELDPTFAQTIQVNAKKGLTSSHRVICADVRQLDPSIILKECALKSKLFGLVGGPPCQSFSSMGRKGGLNDDRGMLMFDFSQWVSTLLPTFFLIENVPNFEKIEQGKPFESLLSDLESKGYTISHAVLNAADYGAPTSRRRLFIIGTSGHSKFQFPRPTHSNPKKGLVEGTLPWVTSSEVLADLPAPSNDRLREPQWHVGIKHSSQVLARFEALKPGGYDYVRKRSRLAPDEPGRSLVAGNWQGARFHIHPLEPREITNREAARLQGIPDNFLFAGERVAVARQIANAVPVQLGHAVAAALYRHLSLR